MVGVQGVGGGPGVGGFVGRWVVSREWVHKGGGVIGVVGSGVGGVKWVGRGWWGSRGGRSPGGR